MNAKIIIYFILTLMSSFSCCKADLLVSSSFNGVSRFNSSTGASVGQLTERFGTEGMAVGSDGLVYVVIDTINGGSVRRYDAKTGFDYGEFASFARYANGIAFGPNGDFFITSAGTNDVRRYSGTNGNLLSVFSQFEVNTTGIAFGHDGNLYVGMRETGEVIRLDGTTGQSLGVFVEAGVIDQTGGIAFGPGGDLFVSSRSNTIASRDGVFRFSGSTGDYVATITTREEGLGLINPSGIAFGPDGNLYVAGFTSGNVQRLNPTTGDYIDDFAKVERASGLLFLSTNVPEPSSLALICAGIFTAFMRR